MAANKPDLKCYVWMEVPSGEGLNDATTWKRAVDLPLTQREADALEMVLQALRPDVVFCTSQGRPLTATLSTRR